MIFKSNPPFRCHSCGTLQPIKIHTPDQLLSVIDLLKGLIAEALFEPVTANFSLECPKTPEGYWQDDLMYYSIRCKTCGRIYACTCDTYHGNGSFKQEQ